jgi:DNA-directed RNA polymerase subunit beta'
MPKTLGHYLLDGAIPSEYRPKGIYTKKDLFQNMLRLAKDDPVQYVKTITKVKKLGDDFSTSMGISVGLDDIAPLYKERNAITRPALAKIKASTTDAQKHVIIRDTQDKLLAYAMNHPGTMGEMARSGSRGSPLQLMRAVGAPAASNDEHDNVQAWLTTHSYSEGLRPSEWWANNKEARMAAAKGTIEVSEPGDLSKILVNNTNDQVITMPDCGTKNGLRMAVANSAIIDRFLAVAVGEFTRNTLIAPRIVSLLQKAKIEYIIVRSPMTCEAARGVCQKCMGLNTSGKLNPVGENVGIRASQALGEPLTQLALNAKHGVRMSGSNPLDIGGLEGFRMIIESPASFKNKATLAPVTGTVKEIVTAPQGGYFVTVNTDRVYVMSGLKPIVKVGDKVHAGDALSEGVPKPGEVVEHKGLGAGRNYIVNKLSDIYQGSGVHVDRRHFEVLAKSTLNHVRIEDVDDEDSAEHGLVRGDVIEYNKLRNIAGSKSVHTPIDSSEGKYLAEGALHHLIGTRISQPMIDELKEAGYSKIQTGFKAPIVSPILQPATRNPLLNPDWLVRLGHRYLKQSILDAAQKGQTADIHSLSPVPGIIFSSEFGEGQDGQY